MPTDPDPSGKLSVLLLDDNADLVELYQKKIQERTPHAVTIATDGYKARALAERQMFDVVIVDAKMDYRGLEFGGLRLAEDLSGRYGGNAILVISRFITAELMRERELTYEFLDKSPDRSGTFINDLCDKITKMRQQQYVFVAMPFDGDLVPLYEGPVKGAVEDAGFHCVRMDEIYHGRGMQENMLDMIEKSKLVVFLADGGNANAYYEAGFADALRKEVVIVTRALSEMRFDIRNRQAVVFGDRTDRLRTELAKRITALQKPGRFRL